MDEWSVEMPGSPSIVPLARTWVREILKDFPADLVDDVALIASELTTNAVRHSIAANGDAVQLRVTRSTGRLRLEVSDGGPRTDPEDGWTEEEIGNFGRGLHIVAELASEMGDDITAGGGRRAWAELTT